MRWQELSTTSHYRTAVAIQDALKAGDMQDAAAGLEELIEALSRSERRALKSQLIRLMLHVIKWKSQPEKRSLSWIASIKGARDEVCEIQEETPSLTNEVIERMWQKCFIAAKRDAQGEMNQKTDIKELSWKEVFEDEYDLEDM
jgi:hypothetical protein